MITNTRSTFGQSNIFAPNVPSAWQHLQRDPLLFIAQWLYTHQAPVSQLKKSISATPIRVICISDTHNEQPRDIPLGDILIHAGDLTVNGTFEELQLQLAWLNSLPHQHKIVVAGNHDVLLDQSFSYGNVRKLKQLSWGTVAYLEKEMRVLDVRNRSVKVYGSPMTPQYGNWAFQYPAKEDVWANTIPETIDIVVTHGPAKGHVDSSTLNPSYLQGCAHLQRELWRIKPQLHVCGHIHSARGVEHGDWGWLRWGYDVVCRGEGGVGVVLMMLAVWVWSWALCMSAVAKNGRTMTSVNAAVVGERGVAEGKQTLLVDLV